MKVIRTPLLRGLRGKPLHPPLTDVTIGALTLGTICVWLGMLGVDEDLFSRAGRVALAGGLIAAVPTALTGVAEFTALEPRSKTRRLAALHWATMVSAVVLFALSLVFLLSADLDEVPVASVIVATLAMSGAVIGGSLGGSLVYEHGVRVETARAELDTEPAPSPRRAGTVVRRRGATARGSSAGEPTENPRLNDQSRT